MNFSLLAIMYTMNNLKISLMFVLEKKHLKTNYSSFNLQFSKFNQSEIDQFGLKIKSYKNAETVIKERQLVTATLERNYELIQTLLNSGVSPDAIAYNNFLCYCLRRHHCMTPLQIAAAQNDFKGLELLIQHGANVNGKDIFGFTALHLAAEQNFTDCLQTLLEAGAKCIPTKKIVQEGFNVSFNVGTTPLHIAARNNNALCLEILMQYGADYNETDERGRTALFIAAQLAHEECVLIQLKNAVGRDILSLPDNDFGYTPLHFAVKYGMVKAVKQLLLAGSDVNCQNYHGFSPLHLCITESLCDFKLAIEILKLLILYGYNTDIDKMDKSNTTPLHYAGFPSSLLRCPEMAKLLIAFGANVNIFNNEGWSLLNCELISFDSDTTILKAVLDSLEFPPVSSIRNTLMILPDRVINPHHLRIILRDDQHLRKMQTWLNNSYPVPPSLKHICRISIRKRMGPKRLRFAGDLPIPKSLKTYILLGVEL